MRYLSLTLTRSENENISGNLLFLLYPQGSKALFLTLLFGTENKIKNFFTTRGLRWH